MALRRRAKAVENLRLANLRDYVITEDEPDLSPCTTRPVRSRIVPRRINEDTYEDIMRAFNKFSWEKPRIDGIVLCDYRRFTNAMILPTTEAIEPWVGWVEAHLGWERRWILENPVACKREIVRRFEGEEKVDEDVDEMEECGGLVIPKRRFAIRHAEFEQPGVSNEESVNHLRRGAPSRMGFRVDESGRRPSTVMSLWPDNDERSTSQFGFREDETKTRLTRRLKKSTIPTRPVSAIGFREVKGLKGALSSLKKKALTNPWRKAKVRD